MEDHYIYSTSNSPLECQWCGKLLGNASRVTYLNGNQAVCDLCLSKAKLVPDPGITGWNWIVEAEQEITKKRPMSFDIGPSEKAIFGFTKRLKRIAGRTTS